MKLVTYFGIESIAKDEKLIMGKVNAYLKTLNRTTSKRKPDNKEREFGKIKHYYWNINKDTSTRVEILPNEDLQGNWLFPQNKECAWMMHVRIGVYIHSNEIQAKAEKFIAELLTAIEMPHKILMEHDELWTNLTDSLLESFFKLNKN